MKHLLPLLASLVFLAQGNAQPVQDTPTPTPALISNKYQLRPTDLIVVQVFQENDLNKEVRVEADGSIVLPLIGKVYVGGLTIAESQKMIEALYYDGYLVNPNVTLQVKEYKTRRVNVLGYVNRPGPVIIPPEEELTLSQAITFAGSVTRGGDDKKVQLRRTDPQGNTTINHFNLREILRNPNVLDPPVQDGDTIYVPESII